MSFNDTDRIRAEQIHVARRTLSVPAERRDRVRPTDTPVKSRHIPKGHDAILKALQDSKATVTIVTSGGGDEFTGTIFGRDKFTITLLVDGVRRVFYKQAIEQFYCNDDAAPVANTEAVV